MNNNELRQRILAAWDIEYQWRQRLGGWTTITKAELDQLISLNTNDNGINLITLRDQINKMATDRNNCAHWNRFPVIAFDCKENYYYTPKTTPLNKYTGLCLHDHSKLGHIAWKIDLTDASSPIEIQTWKPEEENHYPELHSPIETMHVQIIRDNHQWKVNKISINSLCRIIHITAITKTLECLRINYTMPEHYIQAAHLGNLLDKLLEDEGGTW
jgi:hypothetical protein